MQGSGGKPGLGERTILIDCRLPLRFRNLRNQVTDILAHLGTNGETGILFPTGIDACRSNAASCPSWKQADGGAKTREVKLACVWSAE